MLHEEPLFPKPDAFLADTYLADTHSEVNLNLIFFSKLCHNVSESWSSNMKYGNFDLHGNKGVHQCTSVRKKVKA